MTFRKPFSLTEPKVRSSQVIAFAVTRSVQWKDGYGVSYPYVGRAPDIGEYEAWFGDGSACRTEGYSAGGRKIVWITGVMLQGAEGREMRNRAGIYSPGS